jgi:penicillin amidase
VDPTAVVTRMIVAAERGDVPGGWTDPDHVAEAVRSSLRRTWVSLSYRLGPGRRDWSWGGLHRIAFHPFGAAASVSARYALQPVGIGGDATTLGVASSSGGREHTVSEASVYRLAVDLAAPDRMLSSLAPGQSEHPAHRHYADGVSRWLEGRPSLLLTSRLLIEEDTGSRLLLEPVAR